MTRDSRKFTSTPSTGATSSSVRQFADFPRLAADSRARRGDQGQATGRHGALILGEEAEDLNARLSLSHHVWSVVVLNLSLVLLRALQSSSIASYVRARVAFPPLVDSGRADQTRDCRRRVCWLERACAARRGRTSASMAETTATISRPSLCANSLKRRGRRWAYRARRRPLRLVQPRRPRRAAPTKLAAHRRQAPRLFEFAITASAQAGWPKFLVEYCG